MSKGPGKPYAPSNLDVAYGERIDDLPSDVYSARPISKTDGSQTKLRSFALCGRVIAGLALFGLVLAAYLLIRAHQISPETILAMLRAHPFAAPAIFFCVYVLFAVLLVPTLPLNLVAGVVWGPAAGAALSITAATCAASIAFLVARYVAFDFINRWFRDAGWEWLRHQLPRADWRVVAFVRANPIFPFGPMNYLFGVSPIRYRSFAWATALFTLPPCIIIATIGDSLGGIVLDKGSEDWIQNVLLVSAAVTLAVALRYLLKLLASRRPTRR